MDKSGITLAHYGSERISGAAGCAHCNSFCITFQYIEIYNSRKQFIIFGATLPISLTDLPFSVEFRHAFDPVQYTLTECTVSVHQDGIIRGTYQSIKKQCENK